MKVLASLKVLWGQEVLKVLGVPKGLGSKGSGGSEGFKVFRCIQPVNVKHTEKYTPFQDFYYTVLNDGLTKLLPGAESGSPAR